MYELLASLWAPVWEFIQLLTTQKIAFYILADLAISFFVLYLWSTRKYRLEKEKNIQLNARLDKASVHFDNQEQQRQLQLDNELNKLRVQHLSELTRLINAATEQSETDWFMSDKYEDLLTKHTELSLFAAPLWSKLAADPQLVQILTYLSSKEELEVFWAHYIARYKVTYDLKAKVPGALRKPLDTDDLLGSDDDSKDKDSDSASESKSESESDVQTADENTEKP